MGPASPAARTRLIAIAVLLALLVPLVIVALVSGGSDDRAGLRVEVQNRELVVYVDPAANVLDRTEGSTSVRLECEDADGDLVIRSRQEWPFTDTDGGTLDPHVHQSVPPDRLDRVRRCRIPEANLEGAVGGLS